MKRLFMNHHIFVFVEHTRPSKGTTFKKKVRIDANGHARISVPPHVLERENIRKDDKVEFKIEAIEE